jgi:acyl-CoA thioester hydrolase
MAITNGFVWPVRVYYEDTDSGGVVYYANYLKFMERARTEWLRRRGFQQDTLIQQAGLIFAVRSAAIDYLRPGRFNQLLGVSVAATDVGRVAITFTQSVFRLADDPLVNVALMPPANDTDILCTAQIKIASLDSANLRPKRMPEHLYKELTRVD